MEELGDDAASSIVDENDEHSSSNLPLKPMKARLMSLMTSIPSSHTGLHDDVVDEDLCKAHDDEGSGVD